MKDPSGVEFIMLINVKMPTIVGILTFVSTIKVMPSRVKHDNDCGKFIHLSHLYLLCKWAFVIFVHTRCTAIFTFLKQSFTGHSRYLGLKKPLGGFYHYINIVSSFLMFLDK